MLMARRLRDSNNDPMLIILLLVPILGWFALFLSIVQTDIAYPRATTHI